MLLPSLVGVCIFYAALIVYSEYQAKNSYDRLYSSSSRTLAFANRLLATSLGFSSDKLSLLQAKKAKDLLPLIALNANIECLAIISKSYFLSYPPRQFCSHEDDALLVEDRLQKSTSLSLRLYVDSESVANVVHQSRLLHYGGGSILVLGALASGAIYSYRKGVRQRIETDRLIDEIIASSPNPYIIVDQEFKIASISDSLRALLSDSHHLKVFDSPNDNSFEDLASIFSANSAERIISFLSQLDLEVFKGSVSLRDLHLVSKKALVFTSSISVIRKSTESNFFLSLFDETQSFVQKSYLTEQLRKDSLTGVFSRRYLFEVYGGASRQHRFSLFLLDVDNFKEINDSFGHDAGDLLLLEIASALARFCGSKGEVVRLGGDEFVVLIQMQDGGSIASLSLDLYAQSAISFQYSKNSIDTTFSFGSTVLGSDEQVSHALKRADDALMQAKKSGKHTYVVVEKNKLLDGLLTSSRESSLTIAHLQEAFLSSLMELYLQPIFNTDLSCVVGYEALVRLNRHGQLIPPVEFLDSLYKVSVLPGSPVDHYVLLNNLISKLPEGENFWISYNVNEIDLGDSCFDRMLQCLSHLPKGFSRRIVLEVSETTFLATDYSSSLLDRISLLKSMGLRIALDDFGVLSSNIFALSSLPVDIVKLDKFLVSGIRDNSKNQRIIESLKSLSDSLGFELIAEGIESDDEAECLRGLGIVLHQGFFYGKPASVAKITSLV